ncbi:MAG: hypothetical protein ACOYXC_03275 [Candidatus Rifleibacteriota bacterium]
MQNRLKSVAITGLTLAVVLAVQMIGLPNILTGVAVNAVFVFLTGYLDFRSAFVVGFLSPVGGFFSGHLPAAMYPLIPVIMLGNVAFVGLYSFLKARHWVLRYVFPSLIKSLLIFVAGIGLIKWLAIGEQVKWLVMPVIGIQFFTAIAGILIGERICDQLGDR